MATSTEIIEDEHDHKDSQHELVRHALQKRYERDPQFYDTLQKLASVVANQANQQSATFEQVFDKSLTLFQQQMYLDALLEENEKAEFSSKKQ